MTPATPPLAHSSFIKAEALRLGFCACGIAKPAPISAARARLRRDHIARGLHASMHYLERNEDLRRDPRRLMPSVQALVCVALNYTPAHHVRGIADYALGHDYHDVVKDKLRHLAAAIYGTPQDARGHFRVFTDSAPVDERYWARRAGLGFIGRHHQLIVPGVGSGVFLGELFIDRPATTYDAPCHRHCGTCRRCIDACPTGAIAPDGFHAARCLSYLTIECRDNALPPQAAARMNGTFYGCDRCRRACPHNAHSPATTEPLLQPSPDLAAMTDDDWRHLTPERYNQLFGSSAISRAPYPQLMRNIHAALGDPTEK